MAPYNKVQNAARTKQHSWQQTLFLALLIMSNTCNKECLNTTYYSPIFQINASKHIRGGNRSNIPNEPLLTGSSFLSVLCFLLVLIQMLLMLCGDVEPNPGPTTVTKDDIAWIVKELHSLRHKYVNIGKALHVSEGALSSIFSRNEPAGKCLQAVIHAWIMSADSVPTWEILSDALYAMGKDRLADKMKHKRSIKSATDQQGISIGFFSLLVSLTYTVCLLSLPLASSLLLCLCTSYIIDIGDM